MKRLVAIFFILCVAFLIRIYNISSTPPGLTPDETALGYNAFSILKTGKDEYGTTFPIIFKSFGDYKPGLYVYLSIPSIAISGLNEFSIRFPSVLAGTMSVAFIFLIVKQLFKNNQLGYISLIVAAINPWLIFFSRGAWEANVSLMFTLGGIYFFLKSLKKAKFIYLSTIFFSLTFLTYQGAKLSTFIVCLLLIIFFVKEFKEQFINKNIGLLISSFLIGVIILIPVILSLFNGQTQRLAIYNIFNYPRQQENLKIFLNESGENVGNISYYLFHSEELNFIRAILGRYFNNFSGRFLFFEGDWANPISNAPNHGLLLVTDLFILPVGFYSIFRKKIDRNSLFVIFWLMLAPFSVALSRDEVNAVRDLNLAVPLIIILSFGCWQLINSKFKYLLVVYIFGLVYLLDALFVHLPIHNSNYFRYGYKEVFSIIAKESDRYDRVIVEQSFNQPYIYYLFYKAMSDPNIDVRHYQNQEKLVSSQYIGDVGFIEKLDNVEFKGIDLNALQFMNKTIFVGSSETVPDWSNNKSKFNLISEIKYLDGYNVAFKIWETKE